MRMRSDRGSGTLASSSGMMSLHGELRIRAFFDAHSATDQNRHFEFHLLCSLRYASGNTSMSTEPDMSSSVALRVEIALLRFQHAKVGDDARGGDVFVFAGRDFMARRSLRCSSACRSSSLSRYFSSGCPVMKNPRISFSLASRVMFVPVRNIGQLGRSTTELLLGWNTPNRPCWPDSASRCVFCALRWPCRGRPSTGRGGPVHPWRRS